MSVLEFRLASLVLRILGAIFDRMPGRPGRVVLATARLPVLEGNLLAIHDAIRRRRADIDMVLLLEPYGYGLRAKLRYLLRTVRGTYHVRTAGLVVVDNAYLPVHVAPHPTRTRVVQVWHAAGALKRFGVDSVPPPSEPELTFLHRHYDFVVTSGEASRGPWSAAFRTPLERVLPLGTPRTDLLRQPEAVEMARARALAAHPELAGRRVILYAPTFRGRGARKRADPGFDAPRVRAALPASHALVLKTHPNLDARGLSMTGYDVVASPAADMNDLLCLADVLVTDYSSSVFEFALLRRPIVLLVGDLATYEQDPGLYLDMQTEMIGSLVTTADEAAEAILTSTVDDARWNSFITRHLAGCDGRASDRFVERFVVGPGPRKTPRRVPGGR